MSDLLGQLRAFHDGLDRTRRFVLYGAGALSLAAIVGVGVWASAPSYVVLTRAADADEAAAVTQSLSAAGLPFRVDDDGRTIRVPALQEVDARRAASGDDGIVGLEGLDKIDPWVTPFQEQLHRQRMIQGELVRTIDGIAGVAGSTVHLDLPEPSAFLRDVTRPTAAVTLRPDPGTTLDTRTARSIAELVAHAVSGMGAEDVTVVDASSGRMLWGGGGGEGPLEGDLGSVAAAREAALAAGVRAALAQLLGRSDAAAVTVRVELETAAVQQTVNAVDPTTSATASERIETETDTRGGAASGGVPGTDSNVPERTAAVGATSGSRTHETQQTTYQFTTTTTTKTTPAGGIRRLSASVIIDSLAFAKAVAASPVAPGTDAAATEAALRTQIESAVRAALGSNEQRADEVVVSFLPFVTDAPAVVAPVAATIAPTEAFVGVLAVLAILALVAKPLWTAVSRVVRPAAPVVAETPAAEAAAADGPPPPIDLSARLRGHLSRLEPHHPSEVSDLVRQESAHSAEVVRRWLQSS